MTAVRPAEEHGPLGADRVHDHADVVHHHFQRRELLRRPPVGESCSAPVHHDEPGDGFEPLQEPAVDRARPVVLDVRRIAGHVHEVDRTVPVHLVGDVDAVGRLRVGVSRFTAVVSAEAWGFGKSVSFRA